MINGKNWWLTGALSSPVWVWTCSEQVLKILLAPDQEPDWWSSSSSALNLGLDHGPVQLGSGLNHGFKLNLTIPTWWWISHIALRLYWRFQNAIASSVMWWEWVRKPLKGFVRCSWYDLTSFLPCVVLTIIRNLRGKSPFRLTYEHQAIKTCLWP